jgi:hypothetical protein
MITQGEPVDNGYKKGKASENVPELDSRNREW